MRRKAAASVLLLLALVLAFVAWGSFDGDSPSTAQGGNNIVVVGGGTAADSRLAGAEVIESRELANVDTAGKLIVLAPGALSEVSHESLREKLRAGQPIMALEAALTDLVDATGFNQETGMSSERLPTVGEGFYSYVWLTFTDRGDISRSSRGQHELTGPYLGAQLRQYGLLARGQIELIEEGGRVIPLDEYGLTPTVSDN